MYGSYAANVIIHITFLLVVVVLCFLFLAFFVVPIVDKVNCLFVLFQRRPPQNCCVLLSIK